MILFNLSIAQLFLTSSSPSNGSICPGPIEFTCTGTGVGGGITWKVNNKVLASYFFQRDHLNSFPRTVIPLMFDVEIMIINASESQNSELAIDIVSTLSSNISILRGSMIQCSTQRLNKTVNVTKKIIEGNHGHLIGLTCLFSMNTLPPLIIAPPPPSFTNCSFLLLTNKVSIQWSPSFTSQYNVEMYHVVVNPVTLSCPSDQMIVSLLYNLAFTFVYQLSRAIKRHDGSRIIMMH